MTICINITSSCFIEIAKTVKNRLYDNGHICYISTDMNDKSNYYICIGAHDIFWDISGYNYEVYQFEQIDSPHFKNEAYITILKNAKKVYDFSHIGAMFLTKLLDRTDILQKNYISEVKWRKDATKKYDVSFIGSLNNRRNAIMDNISICKWNNLSKKEFDGIVAKSKILINIHYYQNAALEVARIEELLSLNSFIISERSADNALDSMYEGLVVFTDYTQLSTSIENYLSNPRKIYEFIAKRNDLLRKRAPFEYTIDLIGGGNKQQDKFPEIDYAPFCITKSIPAWNTTDFPPISLITITRNRAKFIKLLLSNFFAFKYSNKIEWIIVDDSPLSDFGDEIKKIYIEGLNYIWIPDIVPMKIADKRNLAVSRASNEIILHMDDDDYYYPHSLQARVSLLLNNGGASLVGCSNYGCILVASGNGYLLKTKNIAEASMCYYKEFWETRGFYEHINGEGYAFLKNRRNKVLDMPFEFNFIALNHGANYTKNLRVRDIDNKQLFNSLPNKTQNIIYKL